MKKRFLFVFVTGLVLFSSCQKKQLEETPNEPLEQNINGYYSNGNMLVFESLEDYERVVDQPTKEIEASFIADIQAMNHKKYIDVRDESKSDADLVGDEYLSQILNSDLSVQIGDWIYRVNKSSEKVFALPSDHPEFYDDLVTENTSNKLILEFTTEDDVFYLLDQEDEGGDKSLSANCQSSIEDKTGWLRYADWVDANGIYGIADRRYKFERKARVRYDNWGIYRKLNFEFWHKEILWGTWNETHFSLQVYGDYEVRNGSTGSYSLFPSVNPYGSTLMTSTSTYFYDFIDDHKEIIVYRGTRCLREFELRGWVWMRNRATLNPYLVPGDGVGVYIRED